MTESLARSGSRAARNSFKFAGGFISRLPAARLALGAVMVCICIARFAHGDVVTIERIDVVGNRRLTTDAFLFASGLKAGEPYDAEAVKKAFQRLWDKGLFDDIKVDVTDGEKGKIVTFIVKERPLLVSIDYDKVKALTQSNIEDAFKQRSLDLSIGKPVSQKNLWKATAYIKDLLATKGYLDATVSFTPKSISETSVAVHFNIRQGPRTRIKHIEFVGNEVFSDRQLRAALQQVRQSNIVNHIGGKDLWRPALYDQEVQKILELYRSYGYLDIEVKPPVVEVLEAKDKEPQEAAKEKTPEQIQKEQEKAEKEAQKKKRPPKPGAAAPAVKEPKVKRYVYITVKIKEGPKYKTGTVQVKGNTVFTDRQVLARMPILPGLTINDAALQGGLDRLRTEYAAQGYIYATVTKSIVRREGNIADVTIEINEDQAYKVRNIEFEGNTVTRDSVIRREMRVNEGGLLSRDKVELSNFKIQQLGYIKPDPDPLIEPIIDTNLADVKIKLEEMGRNEVQIGGGYGGGSGGFFFQGSYSTRNFLGRGEILSVMLEVGARRNLYSISFTEPWFLNKPYLLGFSIFRRDEDFAQNQQRRGTGGTIQIGRQIGNFTSGRLLYSYENVEYLAAGATINVGSGAATSVSPVSINTDTTVASITPVVTRDKLNNPFRPTAGHSLFASGTLAGQILGGDNTFFKPLVKYTQYIPFIKKTFFAVHLEGGWIAPFGKGVTQGTQIENVPVFERFFIGGDFIGPRVFESKSISPVAFVAVGGKQLAANRDDIIGFKGRNVFGGKILVKCDPAFDFVNTNRKNSQGKPIEVAGPADQVCNVLPDRVGGNRFLIAQFEYGIPVASPFTLAFFFDIGNAFDEVEPISFDQVRASAGIEARIYLPVFQAPVRFIFGQAIRSQPLDVTNSFQFSIGTSF